MRMHVVAIVTRQASKGRSRRRIPALTWLHPISGAALCRSSQPMVGLKLSHASLEDERLLMAIRATADRPRHSLSPRSDGDIAVGGRTAVFRVLDCRSIVSAKAHALIGKGHENVRQLGGGSGRLWRSGTSRTPARFSASSKT